MAKVQGYYYLHENGDLIYKPYDEGRVADFRESPFVKAFWPVNFEDRETAWSLLVESRAGGARDTRVAELAAYWKCTDEDAQVYAERVGAKLERDGAKWCATPPGFVDLVVSKAGFGDTCLEALAALAKALGYRPAKMWGPTFKGLLKEAGK